MTLLLLLFLVAFVSIVRPELVLVILRLELFLLLLCPLEEVLLRRILYVSSRDIQQLIDLDNAPEHLNHQVPFELLFEVFEGTCVLLERLRN